MRWLARSAVTVPVVVWTARGIAATTGDGHDVTAVARALAEWLKRRIVFVYDPQDREMLSRPADLLAQVRANGKAGGDCDEVATLGAALALAVGLTPEFRALKFPGGTMYGHVFTVIRVPGGIVSLDTQEAPAHVQIVSAVAYPV